jgi:hypoxanthine phosphoribosyltransferase
MIRTPRESPMTRKRVTPEPIEKTFISAESLLRDSMELGLKVVRSGFRPSFLVGVWRGGAPIGIAVQEILEFNGIDCDHIAIRTSSYSGMDQQAKTVRVHAVDYLVSVLNADDALLLIDDVFDSGRSLEAVIAELRRRCRRNMPEQVRIATAYFKPARNRSSLMPDFYVKATDQWLVFPHEVDGLSREEILKHKPVDASFFTALEDQVKAE